LHKHLVAKTWETDVRCGEVRFPRGFVKEPYYNPLHVCACAGVVIEALPDVLGKRSAGYLIREEESNGEYA
jgi:hypothetical protein